MNIETKQWQFFTISWFDLRADHNPPWPGFVIGSTAGGAGTLCSVLWSWWAALRVDLASHPLPQHLSLCVPLPTSQLRIQLEIWRSRPFNYPQISWFPGLVLTAAQFIFARVSHRGLFRCSAFPRRVEQVCVVCVCAWVCVCVSGSSCFPWATLAKLASLHPSGDNKGLVFLTSVHHSSQSLITLLFKLFFSAWSCVILMKLQTPLFINV